MTTPVEQKGKGMKRSSRRELKLARLRFYIARAEAQIARMETIQCDVCLISTPKLKGPRCHNCLAQCA